MCHSQRFSPIDIPYLTLWTLDLESPPLLQSQKDYSARAAHLSIATVRALAAGTARATARPPCTAPHPPSTGVHKQAATVRFASASYRLTPLRPCSGLAARDAGLLDNRPPPGAAFDPPDKDSEDDQEDMFG